MSYSTEKLANAPVVINTWFPDFDPSRELELNLFEIRGLLEQQSAPVIYVANLMDVDLDFQQLVLASAEFAHGANALYHHEKVREVIVATNNESVHMASQNMDTEVYGNLKVRIFGTLDEALDYAVQH